MSTSALAEAKNIIVITDEEKRRLGIGFPADGCRKGTCCGGGILHRAQDGTITGCQPIKNGVPEQANSFVQRTEESKLPCGQSCNGHVVELTLPSGAKGHFARSTASPNRR